MPLLAQGRSRFCCQCPNDCFISVQLLNSSSATKIYHRAACQNGSDCSAFVGLSCCQVILLPRLPILRSYLSWERCRLRGTVRAVPPMPSSADPRLIPISLCNSLDIRIKGKTDCTTYPTDRLSLQYCQLRYRSSVPHAHTTTYSAYTVCTHWGKPADSFN